MAASDLWHRVQSHPFPCSDAQLSFAGRLARDNGWSQDYARRVLEEYRRFSFLAVAAGHPVTPSDQVDQAWHQHLTYSRDYWETYCPDVLGMDLHHGPTRGGASEDAKYRDWYQATLDSYRARFGPPPADIWPEPQARFDSRFVRVNRAVTLLIPRARLKGGAALAVSAVTILAVSTTASAEDGGWSPAALLLILGGAVLVGLVIKAIAAQAKKRAEGSNKFSAGGYGCGASGGGNAKSADGGDGGSGCGSGCGGGCGGG